MSIIIGLKSKLQQYSLPKLMDDALKWTQQENAEIGFYYDLKTKQLASNIYIGNSQEIIVPIPKTSQKLGFFHTHVNSPFNDMFSSQDFVFFATHKKIKTACLGYYKGTEMQIITIDLHHLRPIDMMDILCYVNEDKELNSIRLQGEIVILLLTQTQLISSLPKKEQIKWSFVKSNNIKILKQIKKKINQHWKLMVQIFHIKYETLTSESIEE